MLRKGGKRIRVARNRTSKTVDMRTDTMGIHCLISLFGSTSKTYLNKCLYVICKINYYVDR